VNLAAGVEFPFSLYFPDKQPTAKVNWTYYTQTGDPDGLGVTYVFSDGETSSAKSSASRRTAIFCRCRPRSRPAVRPSRT